MKSADFRIIRQDSHVNQIRTGEDVHRYLITYATADQPQFVALDEQGHFRLVDEERLAARFPSVADAELRLAQARERDDLPVEASTP